MFKDLWKIWANGSASLMAWVKLIRPCTLFSVDVEEHSETGRTSSMSAIFHRLPFFGISFTTSRAVLPQA